MGKVLSWEGHNDNVVGNHVSHAYTWNPDPAATYSPTIYLNVYECVDNNYSNIFDSGHAFLLGGRLLVAGGHFSDGGIVPSDPGAQGEDYIGLNDTDIFDYTQLGTYNPPLFWSSSASSYPLQAAHHVLSALVPHCHYSG